MNATAKDYLLAIVSAALLVLSFPKHNLSFLAWVGLVPLFIALEGKGAARAFTLSFVMGISFLMGVYYWINVLEKFELIDFLLLGVILGFYFGVFGLVFNYISCRARYAGFLFAPCLWVAIEYIRSLGGFLALPWPLLGYTQFSNLPLIQIASLTGVYGVSFLIVMVNWVLGEITMRYLNAPPRAFSPGRRRLLAPAAGATLLVGAAMGFGVYKMANFFPSRTVRVAVIQGNIPQEIRWEPQYRERNLAKHIELTREVAQSRQIALIVWPETTVQGSLGQNKELLNLFTALARDTGAYLMVGSAEQPKFSSGGQRGKDITNSAFLISPEGKIGGRYDKIQLLPFGEYLPLKKFPWPARIAAAWEAGEFKPGDELTLFHFQDVKIATTICWENIFPDLFRQFVKRKPAFTINITNEAWFGETGAPYQFLAMSVFRAVENHVSIARAANTGVSGFIDPVGRILGTVNKNAKEIFVEGYLAKDIPLSQPDTFYTRYGDLFAFACLGLVLVMVALTFAKMKRGGR